MNGNNLARYEVRSPNPIRPDMAWAFAWFASILDAEDFLRDQKARGMVHSGTAVYDMATGEKVSLETEEKKSA